VPLPPLTLVRQLDTHRLVPSHHAPRGESVLVDIADDDAHLRALFELDAATNDRLLAEQQMLPGIGLEELVFGVPHAAVINAAFCHPHPLGARFSGPDRGAWYAAFDLATSQAEVGFHKSVQLAEIGRFHDSVTYDDYLADFSAEFHDLRRARAVRACLGACWKTNRLASSIRARGAPAGRAWRASGRRSSGTSVAIARIASRGKASQNRSSPPCRDARRSACHVPVFFRPASISVRQARVPS
jgi:hypothetical protein